MMAVGYYAGTVMRDFDDGLTSARPSTVMRGWVWLASFATLSPMKEIGAGRMVPMTRIARAKRARPRLCV